MNVFQCVLFICAPITLALTATAIGIGLIWFDVLMGILK